MKNITAEKLQQIDVLHEVPVKQLQWLIDVSLKTRYQPGDILFNAGDPLSNTIIVIEGNFHICVLQNGKTREVADFGPGTITGYLPFSRGKTTIGYGECTQPMLALLCPAVHTREVAKIHYELTEALVHIMTTRVREFTALQQQNEKMLALGKLSAGLAHELNNPAAAIVRNTASLKLQLQHYPELFKQIAAIKISMDEIEPVNAFITEVAGPKGIPKA